MVGFNKVRQVGHGNDRYGPARSGRVRQVRHGTDRYGPGRSGRVCPGKAGGVGTGGARWRKVEHGLV